MAPRVAWFPKAEDLAGNPYWPLLADALTNLGVVFETSHASGWLSGTWLWEHRRSVDVLHFHFVQAHYAGPDDRVSAVRLLKLVAYLLLARVLGYRLVWTMHDLEPTWPLQPAWAERLATLLVVGLCSDVIVHCEAARELLRLRYSRRRSVTVCPHPGLAGAYPSGLTKAAARERLGIAADALVYGSIGGIRPNKGLEMLLRAFGKLSVPDAVLLIAGRPWKPDAYVQELQDLASRDSRVVFCPRELTDAEVATYLSACDVAVFSFAWVLTSSTVTLALSHGIPVIAPRSGCLAEQVGPDAGIFYAPGDEEQLFAALEHGAAADLSAMSVAALQRASEVTWPDMARRTLAVYEGRRP